MSRRAGEAGVTQTVAVMVLCFCGYVLLVAVLQLIDICGWPLFYLVAGMTLVTRNLEQSAVAFPTADLQALPAPHWRSTMTEPRAGPRAAPRKQREPRVFIFSGVFIMSTATCKDGDGRQKKKTCSLSWSSQVETGTGPKGNPSDNYGGRTILPTHPH